MAFKASEVDELFDYDLGGDIKGRVPQPTAAEARKFREAVLALQRDAAGLTEAEADAPADVDGEPSLFDQRLTDLTSAQKDQLADDVLELVIELCKGNPTRDQITDMGALTRLAFVGWLLGVLSPLF